MLELPGQARQCLLGVSLGLFFAAGCGEPASKSDGSWAAEPITMDADVRVIASGGQPLGNLFALGSNSNELVADESGVYWYAWNGAVFGQRRGEAEVVQFLAGLDSFDEGPEAGDRLTMGIASSVDRLFVADASVADSFEYVSPQPPGRVWSVPKDGAAPSVWLESEDEVLVPLTVQGEHLILTGLGYEATSRYYRASLNGGPLEPIELSAEFLEQYVTGPAFYWPERRNPLRVHLHDRPSEQVTQMNVQIYWTCPGYFVSRHVESGTVLVHHGQSRDADSVARIGLLGLATACDAQHAYFFGYSGADVAAENGYIVRLDAASGQTTQLVSPDMPPPAATWVTDIAGEDAENVYVISGDRLLAVRKP